MLGDDEIYSGEIFTDQVLQPHVSQSIRELFRVLRGAQDPFVLTEGYFVLPANTSVFDPAAAGIMNIPEPEFVEWVQAPPATAITEVITPGINPPLPNVRIFAPSHGLPIGSHPSVVIYGLTGFDEFNGPNQSWSTSVIDVNEVDINGCTATPAGSYNVGVNLNAGGYLVSISAANQFILMDPRDRIEQTASVSADSGQTDGIYAWEGGVFRFIPSSQNRLLRITYRMSGMVNTSTTAIVPIDDCQDYIATRTASLAADSRGASARAAQLKMEAVGPTGQADGSGGILGQLLRISIRNLQREQYRYASFRARRNRNDGLLY